VAPCGEFEPSQFEHVELDPSKGLGEKVGELVLGVDVAGLDAPLIQAAPD
jgi:hypothetical protein